MKVFCIKGDRVLQGTADAAAVACLLEREAYQEHGQRLTVGDVFEQGHAIYIDGRWLCPELLTTNVGARAISDLQLRAGLDTGTEGTMQWYEARLDGQLVKRGATFFPAGLDINMSLAAAQL